MLLQVYTSLFVFYSDTQLQAHTTQEEKAQGTVVQWQDRDINLSALRTGVGTR